MKKTFPAGKDLPWAREKAGQRCWNIENLRAAEISTGEKISLSAAGWGGEGAVEHRPEKGFPSQFRKSRQWKTGRQL